MVDVSTTVSAPDNLLQALERWVEVQPDEIAVVFLTDDPMVPVSRTYGQLGVRARAIASQLVGRCVPGDRVVLLFPNGTDFIEAFFACHHAGLVPVPMPDVIEGAARSFAPKILGVVQDSGASLLLCPADALPRVRALLDTSGQGGSLQCLSVDAEAGDRGYRGCRPSADSLALLQYTSGSTTAPKGVMVSHRNVLVHCAALREKWDHTRPCVMVTWLPHFHDMGLIHSILAPLVGGHKIVLMSPASFVRSPRRWLDAVTDHGGTHTIAPNFAYELCLRKIGEHELASIDLSTLRVACNGAEPVRSDTMRRFKERFRACGLPDNALLAGYGMAEVTLVIAGTSAGAVPRILALDPRALENNRAQLVASDRTDAHLLVSQGTPVVDTRVIIVDPETCERLADDLVGEVWVSGPGVAQGYWKNDAATRETFLAHEALSGEGPYLRTGDLGFLHQGELVIVGRLKDLIIVRGRNIHPQDVERTVEKCHPRIRPGCVAAFAIDHGVEEEVAIAAEVRTPVAEDELAAIEGAIVEAVVLEYDVPVAWVALLEPGAILKTSSGKIQRRATRQRVLAEALPRASTSAKPSTAQADDIEDYVVAAMRVQMAALVSCDEAEIDLGSSAAALGLDSVKILELASSLERDFGVTLSASEWRGDASLEDLARQLSRQIRDAASAVTARAPTRSPESRVARRVNRRANPSRDPRVGQPTARARASIARSGSGPALSLFFFASYESEDAAAEYQLCMDASRFADAHGFEAVWFPERHFHPFGGAFPNPAVIAAAVAATTERIRIRAGSVVLPLHEPIRVAEEWSLVDNLSGGRVDIGFASGWNPNDFALRPQNWTDRYPVTYDGISEVEGLWSGRSVTRKNGLGADFEVRVFPVPVQERLNTWLTCTHNIEGFIKAGESGHNVLTALLFQPVDELATRIALYRSALAARGRDPASGRVTLMLHTYLGDDLATVRETVREPFKQYLASSVDLWRDRFEALAGLAADQVSEVLDLAFERYFGTAALFGTPRSCAPLLQRLHEIGVDEVACLIDFGVSNHDVMTSLRFLSELAA